MESFDVIVIGSGPGGYVCAIRCAQLGMKTAIVEKYNTLGGTCNNVGCIPSKAWLDSSEHFYKMKHEFSDHGIEVSESQLNIEKMSDRVASVVKQTADGVSYLMKKNKITVFTGVGSFKDAKTLTVTNSEGITELSANKIVIATGSKPSVLPFAKYDKERIITSTEALKLKVLPKSMIVIGGGVIGMELGSVFHRLGTKVTVVENSDLIISTMDRSLGKELQRVSKKSGMEFFVSHSVKSVVREGDIVKVSASPIKGGAEINLEAEYVLLSTGRRPFVDGLGLENAGVALDERKRINVNDHFETNIAGIYAIGDVVRGAMLAHKAEEEGVVLAELLAGQKPHINYNLIPGVVYTWPEVASVGYTEEELKEKNIEFKTGNFPFKASGRARASMDTDGFVKVLADKTTDEILGVHMIGARMADLIAEAVLAMEFRASAEDVGRMSHAHPTYSEAFKEACLAATDNRAINM